MGSAERHGVCSRFARTVRAVVGMEQLVLSPNNTIPLSVGKLRNPAVTSRVRVPDA